MIKKDLKVNVQAVLGRNFSATKFLPPYIFVVFFNKMELALLLYQWPLHIEKRQKYCIHAFLSFEKRSGPFILYLQWWGTFIVLKENLGKALDQKLLLMNIIYQIQKDMFQQKDDHSGKQKAEVSFNYIAPAHIVIYNWTTRGRW